MGFYNNIFARKIERENYCIGSKEMFSLLVEHIGYRP
jgi:hypothetical protein